MTERLVETNIMIPAAIELFDGNSVVQERREEAAHLQDSANRLARIINNISTEFPSLPDDNYDILHGLKPEVTSDEIVGAYISIERSNLHDFYGEIMDRLTGAVGILHLYLMANGLESKEQFEKSRE